MMCVGAAACPARRILYAGMAKRKASPGGEAGATLVATDEVEATNHRHEIARHCYPRPHPVRLRPDHHSRGMTATGSHIDFGFAARSTTLQGKAFSLSRQAQRRFLLLKFRNLAHRGMPRPYNALSGDMQNPPHASSMGQVVFYLALNFRRHPSESCPKRNRHPG